jgi:excinuclease ABC subunit C
MALTHRLFGIRSCNEVITGKRGRPCLEYDIKRCIAPCVDAICTAEEYGRAVEVTGLFLEGKNEELIKSLKSRMSDAAEGERYEEAAQMRDAIKTVQTLQDRQQKMATTEFHHRDVFGLKRGPAGIVVQAFQVRNGRVVERVELGSELRSDVAIVGTSDAEVLEAALQQFYEFRIAPPEIHVPSEPDEREALETWLSSRGGRKVHIVVPQRGDKRSMVDLASRNAALAYETRFNQTALSHYNALETLQAVLKLASLPRRIECFDISTIQGAETVASMVVCEDGRMRRSDYRKFRIKGEQQNDFAAMYEVVQRRYRKLLEQGGPFPDLVVIDGGNPLGEGHWDVVQSGSDLTVTINGASQFLHIMILRPPVLGVGAFTIPALPITLIYAPPQGKQNKNTASYTDTFTLTRALTSSMTYSKNTKTIQAYTAGDILSKIESAISSVATLVTARRDPQTVVAKSGS